MMNAQISRLEPVATTDTYSPLPLPEIKLLLSTAMAALRLAREWQDAIEESRKPRKNAALLLVPVAAVSILVPVLVLRRLRTRKLQA